MPYRNQSRETLAVCHVKIQEQQVKILRGQSR